MEAPKEVLAALPLWGTALALLLASLWLWRSRARAPRDSEGPAPSEPAWHSAGAKEARTRGLVPHKPEEPRVRAGEKEEKEEEEERQKDRNSDNKKISLPAELEKEDDATGRENSSDGLWKPLVIETTWPGQNDIETFSFKYSPGKLRGNQYKKMMTKEELEEEQRVKKEQLAAIFKLMKDNMETFGEMSDGDMQEQLKLYDM
ncbi:matrix-remodeling-associated protein 7 isoform X1 [Gracilinanus agilis]|uniref:matrix-remodeling-associated protein 7 isoform X1 n=1 Tax=Gracilinanus agilis TaxID=191870 RepID=UPI001CFEFB17|nr:matrix-remodeling-associated protein 7 isoform X1 [Gracilinanus agilis]